MKERIVLQDAKDEGIEIGREEGREETMVALICKKLVKGKSVSEIADAIEKPEEYVSKVCEIASKYLPNYDVHVIMSEI